MIMIIDVIDNSHISIYPIVYNKLTSFPSGDLKCIGNPPPRAFGKQLRQYFQYQELHKPRKRVHSFNKEEHINVEVDPCQRNVEGPEAQRCLITRQKTKLPKVEELEPK